MNDNSTDFNSRVLCSDGTCIGVIGTDGKCKECGKPCTEDKNVIEYGKYKATDEKKFKCKTCGFFAFGKDLSKLKNEKCLGCGEIMGEEPIPNQLASTNNDLLEACQCCKHPFSKRASICPKCNKVRMLVCSVCKKQIPQDSEVCPECGDPVPFEKQSTKKNNDIVFTSPQPKSICKSRAYFKKHDERKQYVKQEKSIPKLVSSNDCSKKRTSFYKNPLVLVFVVYGLGIGRQIGHEINAVSIDQAAVYVGVASSICGLFSGGVGYLISSVVNRFVSHAIARTLLKSFVGVGGLFVYLLMYISLKK